VHRDREDGDRCLRIRDAGHRLVVAQEPFGHHHGHPTFEENGVDYPMPAYRAVADGLDVNEVEDGLVIFQESTDTVHHLNHSASAVLALCDGSRDARAIATFLAEAFGLPEPPFEDTVLCLEALTRRGLVG
jgi:hypothetical protein